MKDPNLIRKGTVAIKVVLPLIRFTPKELSARAFPEALVLIEGDLINVTSLKLQTFKSSGVRCHRCGCRGLQSAEGREDPEQGEEGEIERI